MQDKGIELDLSVTAINSKSGLRWDIGSDFSYNENKVLSLYPGLNEFSLGNNAYATVGKAFPQIKLQDWNRDPQGRVIINKLSGNPTLQDTLATFGTSNPPYILGFHTSISYKGLNLTVLAEGRFGAVIYNTVGAALDFTGVSWYSAQSGRLPLVIPNSSYDDGTGKYVANTDIVTKSGNNEFWANTWNNAGSTYLNSADFWKIREVSLSYTIPQKVIR